MDPSIPAQPSIWLSFLPMLIMTLPIPVIGYMLGSQKGRNKVAWAMLGVIPIINIMAVWYFIGATNLKLENKINHLLISKDGE